MRQTKCYDKNPRIWNDARDFFALAIFGQLQMCLQRQQKLAKEEATVDCATFFLYEKVKGGKNLERRRV